MDASSGPGRPFRGPKPARPSAGRTACLAAVLCLFAVPALTAEDPTAIPIYAGDDGTNARVEIFRSETGAKAVPVIEIPRETVRQAAKAGKAGSELLSPAVGNPGKTAGDRPEWGDILSRHRSVLIREDPEGVSLGNAFDLLGEMQDALRKGKTRGEKLRAVTEALQETSPGEEPLRGTAGTGNRPVTRFSSASDGS